MYAGRPTKLRRPAHLQPAAAPRSMLCGAMKYANPSLLNNGLHPSVAPQEPLAAEADQSIASSSSKHGGSVPDAYFKHSEGQRINTDTVIVNALKKKYPDLQLVDVFNSAYSCDLLAYAAAGHAKATAVEDDGDAPSFHEWTGYVPPARRMDGDKGFLGTATIFGKFLYQWDGDEFIVYLVDGRDGIFDGGFQLYILTNNVQKANELVLAAGSWQSDLHGEVWVYDQGYFSKDKGLWESSQNASWDSVILDEDMKKSLIDDHMTFFDSRETYKDLEVPWKRGLIYYGPPGNGKTISIKATMHMLADRMPTVPTIYVRSLETWGGPQAAVHEIFEKAREFAPCYLVLEDIDTLIDISTRSYFFNEVDGLKQNDGIFIIASTNHLDRLDPGISKRPSRFDRKYYFPDPSIDQREAYCRYWQKKLKSNKDIEFPDKLCRAIAEITDKFSFAYMQEAFVAALLAIAQQSKAHRGSGSSADTWVLVSDDEPAVPSGGGDDLDKLELWVEIKKQVKILRKGMEEEEEL